MMKEEQIIESARFFFNKYGYKRVSMDEIAKSAGVTKKTVYSYFSSKEELLKYFIKEEIQNMKKIVEDVEAEDISFFDKIHKGICSLLKYRKKRDFLNMIIEESESFKSPTIQNSIKQIDETIYNYIKEKVVFATENGFIQVDDIDVTAFLIYKMYIALILEWGDKKVDDERLANNIISILRNGLEKRKEGIY